MKHIFKNVKSYMAVLAALVTGFVLVNAQSAYAATIVTTRTEAVAAFDDGNWGWYRIQLERDDLKVPRAKITVWCEPDNVAGGTKVPCDAIQYGYTNYGTGRISVEYWEEGNDYWAPTFNYRDLDPQVFVNYTPPAEGYAIASPFKCGGEGVDQYRAYIENFRMASSDQWSQWRAKSSFTWNGDFC